MFILLFLVITEAHSTMRPVFIWKNMLLGIAGLLESQYISHLLYLSASGLTSHLCKFLSSFSFSYYFVNYFLQERSVQHDKFSFTMYLCYLAYAPLYIAGPIISFNAFASQVCDVLFYLCHFLRAVGTYIRNLCVVTHSTCNFGI